MMITDHMNHKLICGLIWDTPIKKNVKQILSTLRFVILRENYKEYNDTENRCGLYISLIE